MVLSSAVLEPPTTSVLKKANGVLMCRCAGVPPLYLGRGSSTCGAFNTRRYYTAEVNAPPSLKVPPLLLEMRRLTTGKLQSSW